jgi:hypothetical protein
VRSRGDSIHWKSDASRRSGTDSKTQGGNGVAE